MAINDPKLAREINRRLRPRAESSLGLLSLLQDDAEAIGLVLQGVADNDDVLNDEGPLDFTKAHLHRYAELIGDLLAQGAKVDSGEIDENDEPIMVDNDTMVSLRKASVRPQALLVSSIVRSTGGYGEQGDDSTPEGILLRRVRPIAPAIRRMRYRMFNDVRILGKRVEKKHQNAADDEVIEDDRDDVPPLTMGDVRRLLALSELVTQGSVNTEARAEAIDAACVDPLEVR